MTACYWKSFGQDLAKLIILVRGGSDLVPQRKDRQQHRIIYYILCSYDLSYYYTYKYIMNAML